MSSNSPERKATSLSQKTKLSSFLLVVVSAVLLALSFPKTDLFFLVWIGLVPLMLVLEGRNLFSSFKMGYLCGVVFFGSTICWMGHVTYLGLTISVLYLATYFALFSFCCSLFSSEKLLKKLLILPSVWVFLELVKAYLIGGFDWASLGHTQYKNLPLIQVAEFTGYYGITFLIVAVNIVLKEILLAMLSTNVSKKSKEIVPAIFVVLILFLGIFGFGNYILKNEETGEKISVGIIQGNIEQDLKWFEPAWDDIVEKHILLTKIAAESKPDLIIWPETSVPGFLILEDNEYNYSSNIALKENGKEYYDSVKQLAAEIGIPLLFGVVSEENGDYYNSAVLISSKGKLIGKYNKYHLVPFGEYIPLRKVFPFLADIVPIEDFTSGKEFSVLSLPVAKGEKTIFAKFSPLICFEDTVSRVARKFVGNGLNFFVNITNDGWFKDTKAPFMHMQSSVFRAIENRKYLVRCANTGVSNFINSKGKITSSIKNKDGKQTYVTGFAVEDVVLNEKETFYSKFGDVFAKLCGLVTVLGLFIRKKD